MLFRTTYTYKSILIFACLPLLFSCQSGNPDAVKQDEPYPLLQQNHPLAGKIWDVNNQVFIDKPQLLEKVLASHYILLGETHDNMQHHNDHAWIIQQLARQKPDTAVAFEMVTEEQASALKNNAIGSTEELLDILENFKTGWEYKNYYRPVFNSVFNAKLRIYPGDLDRESMMKIVSKGEDNAPDDIRKLLEQNPLSDQNRESLKKEIEATHCGLINDDMTRAMMLGQQARDANIANNLYKINNDGAAAIVLVSGSGHIRKDRGVPSYLKTQDKDSTILSIAWLEVAEGATEPGDYAKPWGQEKLPFDYAVFTLGADRPDPCEEMKKFMHHKKLKQKESD